MNSQCSHHTRPGGPIKMYDLLVSERDTLRWCSIENRGMYIYNIYMYIWYVRPTFSHELLILPAKWYPWVVLWWGLRIWKRHKKWIVRRPTLWFSIEFSDYGATIVSQLSLRYKDLYQHETAIANKALKSSVTVILYFSVAYNNFK